MGRAIWSGVWGRFKALGFFEDEAALSFVYSAADVFVIPSLQDNLPNTAVEALACGLPTIGSNVGGIPEVVRNGETGLVFPPGDSRSLREGMAALLAEPERRESMAKVSRRIALEEYSLQLQAQRYEALYQKLLDVAPPSKR